MNKEFNSNSLTGKDETDSIAIGSKPKDEKWRKCLVCGLDTTWPYLMHSDASRSSVTHNCRCYIIYLLIDIEMILVFVEMSSAVFVRLQETVTFITLLYLYLQ